MTRRKLRARFEEPDDFVPLDRERHGDPHARVARKLERALGHGLRSPARPAVRENDDQVELLDLLVDEPR